MISNKKIGTEFENEFCQMLAEMKYWVHFITPDRTGAQPFDVIAVKDNKPYAFDCKTNASETFSIKRLEDNQIMAFEKWLRCGNRYAYIAIKHDDEVWVISYQDLKAKKNINVKKDAKWFGIIYN